MRVVTLARKPLSESSVASNVLEHGTGALNINASRIGTGEDKGVWPVTDRKGRASFNSAEDGSLNNPVETDKTVGRWPANLLLEHHDRCHATTDWDCEPGCPVAELDGQTGSLLPQGAPKLKNTKDTSFLGIQFGGASDSTFYGDSGGASRFFKQIGGGDDQGGT